MTAATRTERWLCDPPPEFSMAGQKQKVALSIVLDSCNSNRQGAAFARFFSGLTPGAALLVEHSPSICASWSCSSCSKSISFLVWEIHLFNLCLRHIRTSFFPITAPRGTFLQVLRAPLGLGSRNSSPTTTKRLSASKSIPLCKSCKYSWAPSLKARTLQEVPNSSHRFATKETSVKSAAFKKASTCSMDQYLGADLRTQALETGEECSVTGLKPSCCHPFVSPMVDILGTRLAYSK